ncbi:hypothetical protein BCR42DRAFT_398306 [Absidia repens]|uniref:Uncharacterized protein n=1 Tax=Absidia repens TaxID=90262 RepID=A0A1X2HYG4_9FUNG|nr:hypothetical protein BCR42DRAFT_398306 [Absidia repens]
MIFERCKIWAAKYVFPGVAHLGGDGVIPGVVSGGGAPITPFAGSNLVGVPPQKKKRVLKKMKVSAPERKIWDRLMEVVGFYNQVKHSQCEVMLESDKVDSGLTLLDWVCIDKTAKRDLQAGLRFLLGRRSGQLEGQVNNLSVNGIDSSDTDEYGDSDSSSSDDDPDDSDDGDSLHDGGSRMTNTTEISDYKMHGETLSFLI